MGGGNHYILEFFDKAKYKFNYDDLINEFIYSNLYLFKSYYHKIERWDKLGVNKNQNFKIDIGSFKRYFLSIVKDKEINSYNFFLALHIAYSLSKGINILDTKILFYHLHHSNRLERFIKDFKNIDVIYTYREIRNSTVSTLLHHKNINESILSHPSTAFFSFIRHFTDPIIIGNLYKKYDMINSVFIVKLERLHKESFSLLNNFCKIYSINFDDCLMHSTINGLKWWGDIVSPKFLDGFNPNIDRVKYTPYFYKTDSFVFEFIYFKILKHLKYPLKFSSNVFLTPVILLLIFFPMKFELLILFENMKKKDTLANKFKNLLRFFLYYFKRVRFYYKFLFIRFLDKNLKHKLL